MQRLQRVVAGVLVVGLLAGASISFAVAQGLKSNPPRYVSDFRDALWFSPVCSCTTDRAVFTLTVSTPALLDVRIVTGPGHQLVRLLAHRRVRRTLRVAWDGTDGSGARMPDGGYLVAVRFAGRPADYLPNILHLDTAPPVVITRLVHPDVPPQNQVVLRLRTNEDGTATLAVYHVEPDGSVGLVWRGGSVKLSASHPRSMVWPGVTLTGKPAADGSYILGFVVRDKAGNLTQAPEQFAAGALGAARVVRVRTVEVQPDGHIAGTGQVTTIDRARLQQAGFVLVDHPTMTSSRRLDTPKAAGGYRIVVHTTTGVSATGFQAVAGQSRVLLMLPLYSWQAQNPYDAALDGFPDTPPGPLGLDRPIGNLAALLGVLRSHTRRLVAAAPLVGAVTDAIVDTHGLPRTARIVIISDERVYTVRLVRQLAAFARRGGVIVVVAAALSTPATRTAMQITLALVPTAMTMPSGTLTSIPAAVAAIRRVR
jgi:hypothetical protein